MCFPPWLAPMVWALLLVGPALAGSSGRAEACVDPAVARTELTGLSLGEVRQALAGLEGPEHRVTLSPDQLCADDIRSALLQAATRLDIEVDGSAFDEEATLACLGALGPALCALAGPFSDEGLEPLSRLTGLEELNLDDAAVTDVGLTHLAKLTGLRSLSLSGIQITPMQLRLDASESFCWGEQITGEAREYPNGLPPSERCIFVAGGISAGGIEGVRANETERAVDPLECVRIELGHRLPSVTLPEAEERRTEEALRRQQSRRKSALEQFFRGAPVTCVAVEEGGEGEVEGLEAALCWASAPPLECTRVGRTGLAPLGALTGLRTLDLSRTRVTDEELAHLSGLANLSTLDLSSTWVSGEGLAHLSGLAALRTLDLSGSWVSEDGLAHLSGLTGLYALDLSSVVGTDAGLASLSGLTALRDLDLSGAEITGSGLAHLSGLTKLQRLDLTAVRLDKEGLAQLSQLAGLEWLSLRGSRLTTGLRELSELTGLRWLDLTGNRFPWQRLERLGSLTSLETLELRRSSRPYTDDELARLRALLPGCTISP